MGHPGKKRGCTTQRRGNTSYGATPPCGTLGAPAAPKHRKLPVYVLTVGKGGPKFKLSERTSSDLKVGPNSILMQEGTVDRLTGVLATALGRPVLDPTGLKGSYDLSVQWDDAPVRGGGLPGIPDPGPAATVPGTERGSIFTAVPDQLGLRLEAQRAPVDVLV